MMNINEAVVIGVPHQQHNASIIYNCKRQTYDMHELAMQLITLQSPHYCHAHQASTNYYVLNALDGLMMEKYVTI